jgi:hypothetical protein
LTRERRDRIDLLGLKLQAFATRDEHGRPARRDQLRDLLGRLGQEVLGVIEQEQHSLSSELGPERLAQIATGLLFQFERPSDGGEEEVGAAEGRERHPANSVRVAIGCLGGGLQRKSRLPGSARAGQRQQAEVLTREELDDRFEFALTAEERRCRHG